MGHDGPDVLYPFGIEFPPVAAPHQPKHPVAAALERDMEMGHEPPAAGCPIYYFRCQQIGFDRGDAIAVDAFDEIEGLYQPEKIFIFGALAEIAQVDAGQDDLADIAARCKPFHRSDGPFYRVAAAVAAGE